MRLLNDFEAINMLVESGFERVEIDASYLTCLSSQGYESYILDTPDGDQPELWLRHEDAQIIRQCPVILAFQLAGYVTLAKSQEPAATIPMLQILPPPTIGSSAIIFQAPLDGRSPDRHYAYHVLDLPEDAQRLHSALAQKLITLAGGAECWYQWRNHMGVTYGNLNQTIANLRLSQLSPSYSEQSPQEFKETIEQVGQVLLAQSKPEWGQQWEEIRGMMRDVAAAYWTHYQQQMSNTPARRGATPTSPDIFTSGKALVPTSFPFQAVIAAQQNAASGADRWQQTEGHAPYFPFHSRESSSIIEYNTSESEIVDDRAAASLWAQVKQHTDLDSDVVAAMFAHLAKGPLDDQHSVWFWASSMLDYRGILPIMKADTPGGAKRRAGHRQEDMQEIAQCVNRAANVWITIEQFIVEEPAAQSKRRQRKRKQYIHKGRLLSVDEVWYQRELDTDSPSSNMPIGWRIRAGSWLQTFLEKPNRQVAYMCQQILKYDPYRDQWEKRLGYCFLFSIRMNAAGGGVFNREIGKLLDERSLPIDRRHPERTKQRFEKALNRLVEAHIIDSWEYVEGVQYKARGWIDTWLANKIRIYIAPPKLIEKQEQ